jgi:ribA/ribD-fused uncharacterized protein
MERYVESRCAVFFKTRERWGEFSNMHNDFPLTYREVHWPSCEALYQALRYPNEDGIQEYIRLAQNSMEAKRKAYEFIKQTRTDWQEVKVGLMEQVVRLKLDQYKQTFRILLGQTGDMPIVEKSFGDNFWGAIPDGSGYLNGMNKLGLIWMLLREEMVEGLFHANVDLPLTLAA